MGLLKTSHYHDNRTYNTSPERIDVHEHKAPTDKSVKLLNEFQEKAKENIFKTFEIKNNYINGAVIYYDLSPVSDRLKFYVHFELNFMTFKIDGFIERYEISSTSFYGSTKVQELVCKHVAETISQELINQFPIPDRP